jgi:molecular chaperone DnaJ
VSRAYEVLADPDKRRSYDMGVDPFATGGGGRLRRAGFSFSDVMDAFFGGAATGRGPRSRAHRGQDALVRLQIDLHDAVFGAEEDLTIETAVRCSTCHGDGCQPGTGLSTCAVCGGAAKCRRSSGRSSAR